MAKLKVAREVARLGYDFIFSDVDIVYLKNPFQELSMCDLSCFSAERKVSKTYVMGVNSGFYFLKGTARSFEMLNRAIKLQERRPELPDQNHLNDALYEFQHSLLPVILPIQRFVNSGYLMQITSGLATLINTCSDMISRAIDKHSIDRIMKECKIKFVDLEVRLPSDVVMLHFNGMVKSLKQIFMESQNLWLRGQQNFSKNAINRKHGKGKKRLEKVWY